MVILIVASLLLVFASAWFLSRPFRVSHREHESSAQYGQYVLARDRLLQQLEQIDAQAAEGLLEQTHAKSETARLEYELAGILKRIDMAIETDAQSVVAGGPVLQRWLAWSSFSLFLLIGSYSFYVSWQAEALVFLLDSPLTTETVAMPANQPERERPAPATVPPEALAMVARLEGKLAKNPDDGDGWKRLGRSYMVMGRYQEAVTAYGSAANLLPDDPQIKEALQQLAEIARRGSRHPQQAQPAPVVVPEADQERVQQLEERVAAEPGDAMSWARLGRAYLNIQQQADAERAYAKAYMLEPDNIVILASYAGLVFAKNPRDPEGKALGLFKQLYALDPEHPDGLWFLGLAAYSEGDHERAIELWTKLLGILPAQSEGHLAVRKALDQVQGLLNTKK